MSPPLLVGRDHLLEDFAEALEDGPGSAGRATLYTGARGAGKTVMLNAVEDRAKAIGWLAVSETASPGFVDRLARQHFPRLLASHDPEDDGPSKMADIQRRLDVDVNYASQYRLRLLAAELIEPVRHGYVDFALPYLREYLREHAPSDV